MIVANLATYPARSSALKRVIESIATQVDQLNLVLNEYDEVPHYLSDFDSVAPFLPAEDTKDVGKFYPNVSNADYVFLLDDDFIYPINYVSSTLAVFEQMEPESIVGGYYASVYHRPSLGITFKMLKTFLRYGRKRNAPFRRAVHINEEVQQPFIVDQIGTGTAVLMGKNMPSYEYMKDSQKFMDVRFARWCFENGITPVCLPRAQNWFSESISFDETIYRGFTKKDPPHVAREIRTYAFKVPGCEQAIETSSISE
jgi:hypothetical protein